MGMLITEQGLLHMTQPHTIPPSPGHVRRMAHLTHPPPCPFPCPYAATSQDQNLDQLCVGKEVLSGIPPELTVPYAEEEPYTLTTRSLPPCLPCACYLHWYCTSKHIAFLHGYQHTKWTAYQNDNIHKITHRGYVYEWDWKMSYEEEDSVEDRVQGVRENKGSTNTGQGHCHTMNHTSVLLLDKHVHTHTQTPVVLYSNFCTWNTRRQNASVSNHRNHSKTKREGNKPVSKTLWCRLNKILLQS